MRAVSRWRGKRREEHSEGEGHDWRRRRGFVSLRGTGYREVRRKMKELAGIGKG